MDETAMKIAHTRKTKGLRNLDSAIKNPFPGKYEKDFEDHLEDFVEMLNNY